MKLKISELTDYYIDRYNLQEKGISDNPNPEIRAQFKRNISQQITRLLKQTQFESTSLYEAIEPEQGPRKIEIDTFEDYCLKEFVDYITERYKYNPVDVERDMENYYARKDKDYWDKAATEFNKNIDKAFRSDYKPGEASEEHRDISYTSRKKIIKTGYRMMIQAIYSLYFEDFKWGKLERDTHLKDTVDDNPGAENTAEQIKAMHDLKNYRNYIGAKKNENPKKK